MGAMTKMAVRSNFAITNCCRPTSLEADTAAKSISGVTSPLAFTAVAPQALAIKATRYEPATPSKMGMILIMPFPQMFAAMIIAIATTASHQQVEALDTAEGARFKPMRMMMGPVTTGGRNRITFFTPTSLMTAARTT